MSFFDRNNEPTQRQKRLFRAYIDMYGYEPKERKKETMDKLEEIKKHCIDVIAHEYMDIEYTTTLGTGVNPNEVGDFAWSILLDIFDFTDEDIEPLVHKRIYELKEYYRGDRKEYW